MPDTLDVSSLEVAKPHTVKKFEFIEKYVESWIHKLLQLQNCNGIIYIDCMCNSGIYQDIDGRLQYGTPIRVAKLIAKEMGRPDYLRKQAWIYLNDLEESKIDTLKEYLPKDRANCHIITSYGDGNKLLKKIGSQLRSNNRLSYLMVYDPYQADLDWYAIAPFLNFWGEVIINHMLFDSVRAVAQVKDAEKIGKYEHTYLTSIVELVKAKCRREDYEKRIEEIISELHNVHRDYYIASCPFFNRKNALVYNLIHCTSNIEGFKLFKKTAWQIFGGKSSGKQKYNDGQMVLDFENGAATMPSVDDCYTIYDIATYLHNSFKGKGEIPLDVMWASLDLHPIYPSDLQRNDIKKILKESYGDKVSTKTVTFN
jgi:three-Cys-motif partner protein